MFTDRSTDKRRMDFYDRVKELAKQKNLSLIPMLQSLNINYETYKSAKRLGKLPRTDEAFAIANILDTTVEYLVTGEKDKTSEELSELKKKILDFARSVQ